MRLRAIALPAIYWPVLAPVANYMQIKVAIVEDDEGIRSSLATLIRRAPALRLSGEYPDAEMAVN